MYRVCYRTVRLGNMVEARIFIALFSDSKVLICEFGGYESFPVEMGDWVCES